MPVDTSVWESASYIMNIRSVFHFQRYNIFAFHGNTFKSNASSFSSFSHSNARYFSLCAPIESESKNIYIYIFPCERVYFSAHDSKRYFCIHSFSFIRLIFSFAASPSYCNYQSWSYRLDGRKMKPLHPMYMAVFRNLLGHSTPHTKHIPLSFNLISFLHIVQLFPCHHILFHLFPTKMWSFYMHGQHFKCITFVNTWKWALFLIAHCAILYHLLALGFEKKMEFYAQRKLLNWNALFVLIARSSSELNDSPFWTNLAPTFKATLQMVIRSFSFI